MFFNTVYSDQYTRNNDQMGYCNLEISVQLTTKIDKCQKIKNQTEFEISGC